MYKYHKLLFPNFFSLCFCGLSVFPCLSAIFVSEDLNSWETIMCSISVWSEARGRPNEEHHCTTRQNRGIQDCRVVFILQAETWSSSSDRLSYILNIILRFYHFNNLKNNTKVNKNGLICEKSVWLPLQEHIRADFALNLWVNPALQPSLWHFYSDFTLFFPLLVPCYCHRLIFI